MTEDELRTTPLDELLALYGPGRKGNHGGRSLLARGRRGGGGGGGNVGSGDCDSDFGVALADRWRKTAKECCEPVSGGGPPEAPHNVTRLICRLVKQNRHAGSGDQLLFGENVALSFRDLVKNDGAIPKKAFTDYVKSKHNQEHSKIKWSPGSMSGRCTPLANQGWQRQNFPGWNANWFSAFEAQKGSQPLACDVWVDDPTLLVERDTFANFFHDSEDFFNAFLALAILRWPVRDLQVLLTDLYPKGPFMPMWTKVFRGKAGQSPEPLTAFELARKYGSKRVCFKQLAVAILGAAAPMTVASWDTPCRGVALVRAYADFVVRALGLQHVNRGRKRTDVNVTYAARRASVQWPEKAFCDTAHSYFDCEQLNHLQMRKLGRMVRNDNAVLAGLKKLEATSFPNGANVRVREVDYSLLSFEEQIAVDATTDVLIGPHGAGLMHNVFMADRAHLIELFVDGSSANRHFHNLAFWSGHAYRGEPQANPIAVERVVGMAHAAVSSLDLSELPW